MNNTSDKISAVIICRDEEDNIADCLNSVKWVDSIIVVDSGSKDNTVELARAFTERVYFNQWQGFAKQRTFALGLVETEWVLVLDADERCSKELTLEIQNAVKSSKPCDGYKIPRKSFFLNKWIKHSGWYPNYQLRFFRKNSAFVNNRLVHEGNVVKGNTGFFTSDILHYTVQSLSDFSDKINNYSTLEAIEKYGRKKVGAIDILLRPPLGFLKEYIIKLGFRDGIYGIMVAYFDAITKALTYMKIKELQDKQ